MTRNRRSNWSPSKPGPKSGSINSAGELPPGEQAGSARNIMLRKLTVAPRSRAELAAVLAARGICDEVAEAALDRFVDVGLINDAAYAELLVSSRSVGRGRRALSAELRQRGVPVDVAVEALSGLSPEAEREAALALVRRRLRVTSDLDPQVRVRRLVGQLTRRGFAPGLAFAVVREVVGESPADLDGAVDGD